MAVGEPKATATRLGSYEILHMFARGGMAELFLARSIGLEGFQKLVVLKKILPSFAQNAKFVRLFLDEAKLAAGLDHPSIAHVYDLGMVDNNYFFTMEYVHGKDMRRILQRSTRVGPLPIEHVVHVARSTASALHYAHERGVVHRDVSPSNIAVSYEGAVKLLDFGVAKAATSTAKTRTGALKGKVSYMSPEQARGGALDRRSDVFSTGIVMWEMVATQRLFRAENDLATLQLVMHKPPPSLTALRPDCPPELDRIIHRALAQDPAERYQTAQALQRDLDELARETKLDQSSIALGAHIGVLFAAELEAWQTAQAVGVSLADHVVATAAIAADATSGSQPFDDSDEADEDDHVETVAPPVLPANVEVDAEPTQRTEPPAPAASAAPKPKQKRKKAKEPSGWATEPSIVIGDDLMAVGTPEPAAIEPTEITAPPRPSRLDSPALQTQLVGVVPTPARSRRGWIIGAALAAVGATAAFIVVAHGGSTDPVAAPAHVAEPPVDRAIAEPPAVVEPPVVVAPVVAPKHDAPVVAPPVVAPKPLVATPKSPPHHVARPAAPKKADKPKPKFDPDAPLPPM